MSEGEGGGSSDGRMISRMLFFSDAVFAIVLTLMVLASTGDLKAGLYWFAYACTIFTFRFTVAGRFQAFRRADPTFPRAKKWELYS